MVDERYQGSFEATDALMERHRAEIIAACDELRAAVGVPSYRVWLCPFSGNELVELFKTEDRRFFDDDMPACLDALPRCGEMLVVGRSDAEEINPTDEEARHGIVPGMVSEIR